MCIICVKNSLTCVAELVFINLHFLSSSLDLRVSTFSFIYIFEAADNAQQVDTAIMPWIAQQIDTTITPWIAQQVDTAIMPWIAQQIDTVIVPWPRNSRGVPTGRAQAIFLLTYASIAAPGATVVFPG
jgi:hypothetical protein